MNKNLSDADVYFWHLPEKAVFHLRFDTDVDEDDRIIAEYGF